MTARTQGRSPASKETLIDSVPPPSKSVFTSRWWLPLTALFMGLWTLFLLFLASTTANPVVVSPQQIARADAVIVGHLETAGENRITVERVFKGDLKKGDTPRVFKLPAEPPIKPGQSWVLALSRFQRDYQITILNEHSEVPPVALVYPASPEVIDLVRKSLPADRRAQ